MKNYKKHFLRFAQEREALKFGEFTLKSGRKSPYFFNAGTFNTGEALARLGRYYADAIVASGQEFDMLFGPAYKGIPLVAAVAVALGCRQAQPKRPVLALLVADPSTSSSSLSRDVADAAATTRAASRSGANVTKSHYGPTDV